MSRARKMTSTDVPTQFVQAPNRKIAYRSLGTGTHLFLCARFRGTLESWDPAFTDALAKHFCVITFDYSGTGHSSGEANYDPKALARDVIDLADGLRVDRFVVGGWALGGHAAQIVAVVWPERASQLVLLGSAPPGESPHGPTPAFSAGSLKAHATLQDETLLFFEPMSAESRDAARASRLRINLRTKSRSPEVPEELYLKLLKESAQEDRFLDDGGYRDFLEGTETPILVVSGDHDIGFPVENWFALTRKWRMLFLCVLPRAGNAVHHQYPELVARIISCFVERQVAALD